MNDLNDENGPSEDQKKPPSEFDGPNENETTRGQKLPKLNNKVG